MTDNNSTPLDEVLRAIAAEVGQPDMPLVIETPEDDPTCVWMLHDDDYNSAECLTCGIHLCFNDGTPAENGYRYCPGCGRYIARFDTDWEPPAD